MKNLKTILAVWGGISGLVVIVVATYIVYYFAFGNSDKYNEADNKDVRFVLNWSELGEKRIESVVHSFKSAHSLTGDHLDAYAIKITDVSVEELINTNKDYIKWTRGDNVKGVLKNAVELVYSFAKLDKLTWFPKDSQLMTGEFYVNSWTILLHGEQVKAAELIFVNPVEKMVYFASVKI